MGSVIIACKTMEKELLRVMEREECPFPVLWLEAGNHNSPQRRRKEIQDALTLCDGFDTVILAMTFCGHATAGLESGTHTLVLPRCTDCITLLLGSRELRETNQDLYFLTAGWMDGNRSILKEYTHCLNKYGTEKTQKLFSSMFRHYRGIAYVSFPFTDPDGASQRARKFAELLGLPFFTQEGSSEYLSRLVSGPWDSERFLRIPPGNTIKFSDLSLTGGSGDV